jgi:hypothetical protein
MREKTMRMILLAAGGLVLASCTTPNMNAGNANRLEAANDQSDDNTRTPEIFRKPAPQVGKWGGYGYGGRY